MKKLIKNLSLIGLFALFVFSPFSLGARLDFLIPAGPGGGLDSTARAMGDSLLKVNPSMKIRYENRTGGGGGKAMSYFVNSKASFQNTLLVNSTPLLIRSIQGVFKQTYEDVVPIAALITDPAVIAVNPDSEYDTWNDVVEDIRSNKKRLLVGGGSVRGSLDHIALSLLLEASGVPIRSVQYVPYDGGGKALVGLMSSEVNLLVSGLGETINQHRSKSIKILGISSEERLPSIPSIPTFKEDNNNVVFSNWRGVFASKTLDQKEMETLKEIVFILKDSSHWQIQLDRYGWTPFYLNEIEFKNFLRGQEAQMRETLIKLKMI